jgi:hypothetical protein
MDLKVDVPSVKRIKVGLFGAFWPVLELVRNGNALLILVPKDAPALIGIFVHTLSAKGTRKADCRQVNRWLGGSATTRLWTSDDSLMNNINQSWLRPFLESD